MAILVLVRHGQSQWNLENKFTGWVDVDLTPQGEAEAKKAGEQLKNIKFDKAYTSDLKRAQKTLDIILGPLSPWRTCLTPPAPGTALPAGFSLPWLRTATPAMRPL